MNVRYLIAAIALLGLPAFAQELKIERETRRVPFYKVSPGPAGWSELDDGLFRATFRLPDYRAP